MRKISLLVVLLALGACAPDAPPVPESGASLPGPGPSFVFGADGALSGTPSAADLGPNHFTVAVQDPSGAEDRASLRIAVHPETASRDYWPRLASAPPRHAMRIAQVY